MTRNALAAASGVSLRFLAQLEGGHGNASLIVLRHIAAAMGFPIDSLVSDTASRPIDQTLLVQTLNRLQPDQLAAARRLINERFGRGPAGRGEHIALIGLRGAGKTTLGRRLAQHEGVPFIELDREVEREFGASIGEILQMHGQPGYRRCERQCLEAVLARHPRTVIETGGGLATDPETLDFVLEQTRAVWVRATPQEHMQRVIDQGDMRPMAKNREAMRDLKEILRAREPFYMKAPLHLNTSRKSVERSFRHLLKLLDQAA
jgi:XRE family aerobic/anaerobic benzoate catabolism transcriptional regulator